MPSPRAAAALPFPSDPMPGPKSGPVSVRQVALAGGTDLDATLRFWTETLGLAIHAGSTHQASLLSSSGASV